MAYTDPQNTGLSESPKQAALKRQLDAEFEERGKNANFQKGAEGMKDALGIGELDPEAGLQLADEARALEESEEGRNNELDLDAALDAANTGVGNALENKSKDIELGFQEALGNTNTRNSENNTGNQDAKNERAPLPPEQLEKISEHPDTPLLENMVEQELIGPEDGQIIARKLSDGGSLQDIPKIPEIDTSQGEKVAEVLKFTKGEQGAKLAKKEFTKDFGDQFSNFQNTKGEMSKRDADTYNMVAGNYFILGEQKDSPEVKKAAMCTAFETTFNREITGKEFPRDETFTAIKKDIFNPKISASHKLQQLIRFRDMLDTTQGQAGKKQNEKYQTVRRKARQNAEQNKAFQATQAELGNREINTPNQEVPETKTEKPKEGDVRLFGGGKFDVAQSEAENKEAA